jgi:hypothetical protein
MPTFSRTLAVAVPDQADIGKPRHVVLRVVLPHRGTKRFGRSEVLLGRQRLVAEHERQMLGQCLRQCVARCRVDRCSEVDAVNLGAE